MDTFLQNAKDLRGAEGEAWANAIPELIKQYEQKWDITVREPFALTYNYAAPAQKLDGSDVVIKIGFPGDTEFLSEIEALKTFKGEAAVQLFEEDTDNSVILLERVLPGKSINQLKDNEAETHIAANVLKRLCMKAPQNAALIPLEKWFEGFAKHRKTFNSDSNPIPQDILSTAERLFAKLLETTTDPKLIHGDFNHNNILSSQRDEWLIIDPKGVIGDPLYDTSVFLYNYLPDLSNEKLVREVLEKRIQIFSQELSADKERIREWGIAQSVLSAIWSIEDHGEGWKNKMIDIAKILETI